MNGLSSGRMKILQTSAIQHKRTPLIQTSNKLEQININILK